MQDGQTEPARFFLCKPNFDDVGKAPILGFGQFRIRVAGRQMEGKGQMKTLINGLLVVAVALLGSAAHANDTAENAPAPAPRVQETAASPTTQNPETTPARIRKPRPGTPRPKDMDLRHCLELPTSAEIAACAGE